MKYQNKTREELVLEIEKLQRECDSLKALYPSDFSKQNFIEERIINKAVVDSTSDMIWSVDSKQFGLLSFNKSLYDYFIEERGIQIKQGDRPEELFPPGNHVEIWHDMYTKAIKNGSYSIEYKVYSGTRILELKFNLLKRDNEIFSISVFGKDITERKQKEKMLQESEEKFRLSFMTGLDAFYIATLDEGLIIDVNQVFSEVFGYTRNEVIGKTSLELNLYCDPADRTAMVAELKEKGSVRNLELKGRKKDGTLITISISVSVAMVDTKNHIIGVMRDITKRKQDEEELNRYKETLELLVNERTEKLQQEIKHRILTENALSESETKYRNLVDHSTSIVLEWDTDGNVVFLNQFGLDFFGFTAEEILGKNVLATIVEPVDTNGNDLKGKMQIVQKHPEDFQSSENENVKKNGEKVWIAWTNKGIYNAAGQLIRTLSVGIDRTRQREMEIELLNYRDYLQEMIDKRTAELTASNQHLVWQINERKQAEKTLTESEEKFRLLTETAATGFYILQDNKIVYINPSIAESFGYSGDEITGDISPFSLVHPDDADRLMGKYRESLDGKPESGRGSSIYRGIKKDGSVIFFEIYGMVINYQGRPAIMGNMVDITRRKLIENSYIESEEKFRHAFDHAAAGACLVGTDGKFLRTNNAFKKILGYSEDEILNYTFNDITHPDDLTIGSEVLRKMINGDIEKAAYEKRYINKNGNIIWTIVSASIIKNLDKPHVIIAQIIDITDRKEAEEKLRISETKFKTLYEQAPLPYQSIDKNFVLTDVNWAWMNTLGYERKEVIGKFFTDFLIKGQKEKFLEVFSKITTNESIHNFECDLRSKSGTVINALFNLIAHTDIDGKFSGAFVTFKDISQEKQFDKRIANAIIESEETQRRLFAQELHDGIGPMLSAVKLFTKSIRIRKDYDNVKPLMNKVDDIIDESIIIIKEISHKLSPNVIVNHGLDSALSDFIKKINESGINIKYQSNLRERLSEMIETGLYRVVTEMVSNSLKYASASRIGISVIKNENNLQISYSDNGCGFDVSSILKVNKGNGLFNIINRMIAMDAKYRFISSPGKGFEFHASVNLDSSSL